MNKKKSILSLFVIVSLAFLLRVAYLDKLPYGITPDEASQGVAAASFAYNGRDEWGELPSLTLKSFLDYKAPLLTLMMVPGVKMFGLNIWTLRLPSAIFGTLTLIVFYFLVNFWLDRLGKSKANLIALVATIVMALSYNHIAFSRMALEANMALFWVFLSILCYQKHKRYGLAFLFGFLAMISYHSAKLFMPMILTYLIFNSAFESKTIKSRQTYLRLIIVGLMFGFVTFGHGSSRAADVSILSYLTQPTEDSAKMRYFAQAGGFLDSFTSRIIYNKVTHFLDKFIENAFSYLSPAFWFTEGGREITYAIIPGHGLFPWWSIFFVLIGCIWAFSERKLRGFLIWSLVWLIAGILPAALTKEGYRPNRIISLTGLIEIYFAFGLVFILEKYRKYGLYILGLVAALYMTSTVAILSAWMIEVPVAYPTHMSMHWRKAFEDMKTLPFDDKYKEIWFNRGGQKQALTAFFLDVKPEVVQEASKGWQELILKDDPLYLDILGDYRLDKYRYVELSFPEMIRNDVLYVSDNFSRLPENRKTIHIVKSSIGQPLVEFFTFEL